MKRKAILLAVLLCLGAMLTACGNKLNRAGKDLSNYTIVATYDATTQTVTANQKVSYINNYDVPLGSIKFHLYANAYRQGAVFSPTEPADYPNGASYGGIEVTNVKLDGADAITDIEGADDNVLSVVLPQQLYPNTRAEIEFQFVLTLPNVKHRLGYADYTTNLGNWYPIAAEYRAGEFLLDPYYSNGDPFYSSAANYDITLTTPAEFMIAASGERVSANAEGDLVSAQYKATAVRDFAFVISNSFELISEKLSGTTVNYYYFADSDPAASLKAATDSIRTFNNLFGDYPYPTYSVVQTQFSTAGMEYPALVYINETLERAEATTVIVHETAHQWWYAVVGNDQIREAWLDEGLAEYSTTLFYEHNPDYGVTKSDRIMEGFRIYMAVARVFEVINGSIDTSMNRPLNEYATSTEYTCMIYVKGQLMFDSLRGLIGETKFLNALKNYYQANQFKIATKSDLVGAFESAAGTDLEGIFDSWLDGKIVIADLYSNK